MKSVSNDTAYMSAKSAEKEERGFKVKVAVKKKKGFFDPSKYKKRFIHKAQMRVKELHDEEHYIVDISTPDGIKCGIVTGYRLKNKDFWHNRLACYPIIHERHWTRRLNPPEKGSHPKTVEVILPWRAKPSLAEKNRGEDGRRMVTFVTPFSSTESEEREKNDPEYAKMVMKYMIR